MAHLPHLPDFTLEFLCQHFKSRLEAKEYYTDAGNTLVSVCPLDNNFPETSTELADKYHAGETTPHVFATAESAYRGVKGGKDQTISFLGDSTFAKVHESNSVVKYLFHVSGGSSSGLTVEKVACASHVLDAFGRAKTLRSTSAFRFVKVLKLNFDASGKVSGASVKAICLDEHRVVHRNPQERNFNIFYQLFAGLDDATKTSLGLTAPGDFKFLSDSPLTTVGVDDAADFKITAGALHGVGLSDEDRKAIFDVLAAILHLGNITFSGDEHSQIDNQAVADRVAHLLGVPADGFSQALTLLNCQLAAKK